MMWKKLVVLSLMVSALFTVGATNANAEGESIDYSKVLQIYMPGAQWSLNGDGCCDQLTIHDGSAKPTKAELDAFWQNRVASGAPLTPPPPPPTPIPDSLSLDYSKILSRRFPGMQWSLNGDGCCDQLTIHDGSAKPTKAQLDAMWSSVEQEILAEMQAAYRAATGGSAEDDSAVDEGLVAAPVTASRSSFVVQSGAAQRSQLTESKAVTVRGGLVYLNVVPTPSAGPSRELVLRATNGKKTFVWYLNSRVGEPRVIGSVKRFAGFRFTLRDVGRVTERIRFVR
jgi:hypothetical protein